MLCSALGPSLCAPYQRTPQHLSTGGRVISENKVDVEEKRVSSINSRDVLCVQASTITSPQAHAAGEVYLEGCIRLIAVKFKNVARVPNMCSVEACAFLSQRQLLPLLSCWRSSVLFLVS